MYYFQRLKLNKLLLLSILLLPIGLSTISLVHALEIDQEIHQQHQCKVYDLIQQALSSSPACNINSEKVQSDRTFYPLAAIDNVKQRPRTRSPPHNTLFLI